MRETTGAIMMTDGDFFLNTTSLLGCSREMNDKVTEHR